MSAPFARCNAIAVIAMGLLLPAMVHGEGTSVCSKDEYGAMKGGDEYMCVDWSVGSETMKYAQAKHVENEGESVIFGLGSYGSYYDDNMGKCYKFTLDTDATVPIIGQVTNYGSDIGSGQFDMQMGGGGFGVWNACAGAPSHARNEGDPCNSDTEGVPIDPLFPGCHKNWGKRCGGQAIMEGCEQLPEKPAMLEALPNGERNLVELCQDSFWLNVRGENSDAGILSGERIRCPTALLDVTTLKRADDDDFGEEPMYAGTLTSTMDCCAPAGSYLSSNPKVGCVPGFERIVPCTVDGYTRSTIGTD